MPEDIDQIAAGIPEQPGGDIQWAELEEIQDMVQQYPGLNFNTGEWSLTISGPHADILTFLDRACDTSGSPDIATQAVEQGPIVNVAGDQASVEWLFF